MTPKSQSEGSGSTGRSIFEELKEKHGTNYSNPQFRLWAHMIVSGTHEDLDDPPRVPMILGAPLPKRQKQESITAALVGAATAYARAISPPPTITSSSESSTSPTAARPPLKTLKVM
jgi:hypothetical protein